MEINDLIKRFGDTPENQSKAIFSTIFIAGNQLQTIFDKNIPEITLKQFMLLTMLRQSGTPLTLTQLGKLLGCSRQNIKKLAYVLEKKGFVTIQQSFFDSRALTLVTTQKADDYFETVFSTYEKQLNILFEGYTTQEIAQLFHLLMKLYGGIEQFAKKAH